MENIISIKDLKDAILVLEIEHETVAKQLKEEIHLTYESLKPANILKNAIHDIKSSPYLIDNVLGAVTGFATGYISKKILVGSSNNLFRKLFGFVFQFGVTNIVAQNPEAIKSFGNFIMENIFNKKEENTETA